MRRIHDLRCLRCDRIETDVVVEGEAFPECGRCGGERDWIPSQVRTDIWGAPTYIRSLDQEFGSRSELRSYLKQNGLEEAGDKVNGARAFKSPEPRRGTGRAYRYKGDVTKLGKRA
jgi:hypothetical protein